MSNKLRKKKAYTLLSLANNESGVALLMVSTAIVVLSILMITFTYETNINKLQSFNIEDKAKARLMAESGLQFAMVRLRLYKEAYNYLEQNAAAKNFADQQLINSIWSFPFIYPIPVSTQMNRIQKDAIAEFSENSLLEGELQLTINNISNKMNLNLIRVSLLENAKSQAGEESESFNSNENEEDKLFTMPLQLQKSLNLAIERKSRDDHVFSNQYMGIDTQRLVEVLTTYLSDVNSLNRPVDNEFTQVPMEPKYAPMASFSEIYSLPLWDDEIVDLIKNEFTIHGAIMIDLNRLTDQTLRLLIPELMDEDITEFFRLKNDPDYPLFFNKLEDFKAYWVRQANAISNSEFDQIFQKYAAQGIKFGPSPTLFQVQSNGSYGRAEYKLTAYISIPAQPTPVQTPPEFDPNAEEDEDEGEDQDEDQFVEDFDEDNNDAKPEKPTRLLEPRIVEIFVN